MVIDGIEYLDDVNWRFVKERQEAQLATAKAVAQICEENGFRYFLDGGTLLGAFRHGGFIPWDDDIDFAMPRPDYEKFLALFNQGDYKGLTAINWRQEDCSIPFTKVMRLKTGEQKAHHPSAMDIFPMDAAPRSHWVAKFQMKAFIITINVLIFRLNRKACSHPYVSRLFSALLPKGKRKVVQMFEKYFCRESDWLPNSYVGVRYQYSDTKYFVPYSVYDTGRIRKVKFCDTEFRVPEKAEEFLNQFFGDWRRLPPIERRVPKHEIDAAWFYSDM